jgi:hypothetical protein
MCQGETHSGAVHNAPMAKRHFQTPEAKRLEIARIQRGFKDARAASDFFGWKYDTYIQHERGERGLSRSAAKYAKAFKVSRAWLLTGEGPQGDTVPIVGIVGAGGEVAYDQALGGEQETVPRPAGAPPETVAAEIRGDSLGPQFNGWYALYARREDPVTDALIGNLCVVGTTDGRTLVKWLRQGRRGFNLISGTGAIEENVKLAWGAKVIDLKQR